MTTRPPRPGGLSKVPTGNDLVEDVVRLDEARADKEARTQAGTETSKPAGVRASTRARTQKRTDTPAASDLRAPVVPQRVARTSFTTYVENELLARVAQHCALTGESRVNLVDRALRLALGDDK